MEWNNSDRSMGIVVVVRRIAILNSPREDQQTTTCNLLERAEWEVDWNFRPTRLILDWMTCASGTRSGILNRAALWHVNSFILNYNSSYGWIIIIFKGIKIRRVLKLVSNEISNAKASAIGGLRCERRRIRSSGLSLLVHILMDYRPSWRVTKVKAMPPIKLDQQRKEIVTEGERDGD